MLREKAIQGQLPQDYASPPFSSAMTVMLIHELDYWRQFGERSIWYGL